MGEWELNIVERGVESRILKKNKVEKQLWNESKEESPGLRSSWWKSDTKRDANRLVRLSHTGKPEQAESVQKYSRNRREHLPRIRAHAPYAYVAMSFSSAE